MVKRLFIFLGPPGSGKGSLSQFCIERFGWKQLSTGALCRKHIVEQTEIGKQIDFTIKSGKLIADDLIATLVEEWLAQNITDTQTVILDGFPRTKQQTEVFLDLMRTRLSHYQLSVVQLRVTDTIAVERLGGRAICANKDCQEVYSLLLRSPLAPKKNMECDKCASVLIRRSDDDPLSIVERLRLYHDQMQNVVNCFVQTGIPIHQLNGERMPTLIFEDFERLLTCEPYDYHKK